MTDAAQTTNRRPSAVDRAYSISDLRELSRRRLPKAFFDFIDGAAGEEITLRDNAAAFRRWQFRPRVAKDVSRRNLETSMLGRDAEMPLLIAPTGLAGMYWPNGELHAMRAAAAAGIPLCLSTNSIASLEEVAEIAPDADRWFQIYFLKDQDWMFSLVERARKAKYRVLCVTMDLAVHGRRARDEKNGFTFPLRPRLSNVLDLATHPKWVMGAMRSRPRFGNFEEPGTMGLASIVRRDRALFDPKITWDNVAIFRKMWDGPLVVKGILHPEDAKLAVDVGADAVMVSNHGGRQLDAVPAVIDAVPDIVAAVDGKAEVIVDGGVSRGADIFISRALGATACSIGRSYLWGLAAGGEAGLVRAIEILREELDNTMSLMGVSDIGDIERAQIYRHDRQPHAEA